jgi:glutaredoxin
MVKKGSYSKSSLKQDNWLFYTLIGIGIVLFIALGYLLFSRKCFEKFTNSPASLEYYYMKKCPHCKDFNTVWDGLKDRLASEKMEVNLVKIDLQDPKNKDKIEDISGAPTIMFVHDKTRKEYNGKRDLDEIVKFLKTEIKAPEEKTETVSVSASEAPTPE